MSQVWTLQTRLSNLSPVPLPSVFTFEVFIEAALTMKYFFDKFNFESGGALAALMLGLAVKEMWRRQWPRFLAAQVGSQP